jgi:LCP family protein required for cell wall assembly
MSAIRPLSFARRCLVACLVVTVVSTVAVVLVDQYGQREFAKRKIVRLAADVLTPTSSAKPANFLMIGTDTTGRITKDDLPDTMMVLHIDPAVRVPLLVSFPRDLIVNIPGHGTGQLNAAFAYGGANLLIRTLTADFGIPINHYLQVDFAGFKQIVDAIGHVQVWFPTPMHDPYVGLNVAQAGCVSLTGAEALAYARSRHYYVPNDPNAPATWSWNYAAQQGGQGWTATGSDIDRIPRQQYFLRTLAQAAINKTKSNPFRIIDLMDAVMTHLSTDNTLTFGELKAIARTFEGLKPAQVAATTLPWKSDPADPNRVVVAYPAATALLNQLNNFTPTARPASVDPHTITVRVLNGAGIPGLAAQVLRSLTASGFRAAGPAANAARSDYTQTEVHWASSQSSKGPTVAYATGAQQSGAATTSPGADVVVIVGRDWGTLQHHLASLPSTAAAKHPHTTTPPPAGPATTVPAYNRRFIPVNPKTGLILVGCPPAA